MSIIASHCHKEDGEESRDCVCVQVGGGGGGGLAGERVVQTTCHFLLTDGPPRLG